MSHKKNSANNCYFVLNSQFLLAAAFSVTFPGRRKSGYVTGRTQNIRDKPALETLTLMTTLTKASKLFSHNKVFVTHSDKNICCLVTLNKFAITTLWVQHNTTFCPHSVFVCFVWISEQTAIISLHNIKGLDVRRFRINAESDS